MAIKTAEGLKPGSIAFKTYAWFCRGAWTTRQVALFLGVPSRRMATTVDHLRKAKLIHRCGWTEHKPGDHSGPQAVYAKGWADEPPHPKFLGPLGSSRRYDQLQKARKQERAMKRVTSVFDLAGIDSARQKEAPHGLHQDARGSYTGQ